MFTPDMRRRTILSLSTTTNGNKTSICRMYLLSNNQATKIVLSKPLMNLQHKLKLRYESNRTKKCECSQYENTAAHTSSFGKIRLN